MQRTDPGISAQANLNLVAQVEPLPTQVEQLEEAG